MNLKSETNKITTDRKYNCEMARIFRSNMQIGQSSFSPRVVSVWKKTANRKIIEIAISK
jgi:hypothetical protein